MRSPCGKLTAYFFADVGLLSRKRLMLSGVHEHVVDFDRLGLEDNSLPNRLGRHNCVSSPACFPEDESKFVRSSPGTEGRVKPAHHLLDSFFTNQYATVSTIR